MGRGAWRAHRPPTLDAASPLPSAGNARSSKSPGSPAPAFVHAPPCRRFACSPLLTPCQSTGSKGACRSPCQDPGGKPADRCRGCLQRQREASLQRQSLQTWLPGCPAWASCSPGCCPQQGWEWSLQGERQRQSLLFAHGSTRGDPLVAAAPSLAPPPADLCPAPSPTSSPPSLPPLPHPIPLLQHCRAAGEHLQPAGVHHCGHAGAARQAGWRARAAAGRQHARHLLLPRGHHPGHRGRPRRVDRRASGWQRRCCMAQRGQRALQPRVLPEAEPTCPPSRPRPCRPVGAGGHAGQGAGAGSQGRGSQGAVLTGGVHSRLYCSDQPAAPVAGCADAAVAGAWGRWLGADACMHACAMPYRAATALVVA